MPRPRVHDPELLLDAAERLAVESGLAAVTVRALSGVSGVSNGAIYHAFGSRAGLVGQAWLRAARRFLDMQDEMVAVALRLGATPEAAIDAVVAAADAPARFTVEQPMSGRFLLTVSRSELLGHTDSPADIRAGIPADTPLDLPEGLAADLQALDQRLTDLFVTLSRALWGHADRYSVEVIRDCVVELPNALLLRGRRAPDPAVRERIAACVRAVLALGPPAAVTEPSPPTFHDPTNREDPA